MTSFHRTTFLFPRASFLSGLARVLDIGGTYNAYNSSESPEQADRIALENDWQAVGDELREAMGRAEDEEA